jgi:hypothetical protein
LIIKYLLGTFLGEHNYLPGLTVVPVHVFLANQIFPGLTVVPRPRRTEKEIVTDDDLRCQVYIHVCIK